MPGSYTVKEISTLNDAIVISGIRLFEGKNGFKYYFQREKVKIENSM